MGTLEFVLGILLLVMAVFLIAAVLMQSSKSHRLSGTIAGGAETFFGKQKGKTIDAILSKVTTVVAIIFVLAVVAVYALQGKEASDPGFVGDEISAGDLPEGAILEEDGSITIPGDLLNQTGDDTQPGETKTEDGADDTQAENTDGAELGGDTQADLAQGETADE